VKVLANLPYITISRTIQDNIQHHIEEEHTLILSHQYVSSSLDSFFLEEVLDMSYRFFSGQLGIFYLHTTKGMFSYKVKQSPENFIQAFKQLR